MRLTINNIIRGLAIMICVFFIGPRLLSAVFDRETGEESYAKHRRAVRHNDDIPDGPNIKGPHGIRQADNEQDGIVGISRDDRDQVAHLPKIDDKNNEDGKPTRGPQAVFKSGIIGNFEPIIHPQSGPGEGGQPVYHEMSEEGEAKRQLGAYGFNMVVSDKIALNRTIPDTREDECKYWHYPTDLPKASVILVFHNEGFSTLVRTVHSVINMSPKQYLHEIVMVDDFSDKPHLKKPLEDHLKQFGGLVKLFRNDKREGLINTRTIGARHSTGDVIIFLDAHCECNKNWLVPLLTRIRHNRKIMAVPTIDGIDYNTFRISPVYGHGEHFRGIFEWGFLYKESRVPQREQDKHKYSSEPYWAPTHAGGLFAMDRKYFFELGAYDDGLLIWGGENFELSFKIWQCGGEIEWVPCSRVAHVYRNHMPYGFGNIDTKIPIIQVNYMRVVEVWLDDEFKEYFYTREPSVKGYNIGDVSKQLKFKKDNNCKSFNWFMSNIAYEVYDRFPPPPANAYWGQFEIEGTGVCWDAMGFGVGRRAEFHGCHRLGGSQLLRLNIKGQLAAGERCLVPRSGLYVEIIVCPIQPNGDWEYMKETKQIRDKRSRKCVTYMRGQDNKVQMQTCNAQDPMQKIAITEIRQWDR